MQMETESIKEMLSQSNQDTEKNRHQAFYQVKPNTL